MVQCQCRTIRAHSYAHTLARGDTASKVGPLLLRPSDTSFRVAYYRSTTTGSRRVATGAFRYHFSGGPCPHQQSALTLGPLLRAPVLLASRVAHIRVLRGGVYRRIPLAPPSVVPFKARAAVGAYVSLPVA